ncbi:S41 family peptidase [candidate division KSB1 bacterium]|nr:S41 family peptidase [candidate division KSB1 bacterium]
MRTKRLLLSILILSLLLCVIFLGAPIKDLWAYGQNLYAKMTIFNMILNELQKSYVEEVDPIALMEDAIKGMLSNLDPHTTYMPKEQFESWNRNFEGYSGIGIRFEIIRGKITVMSVMEDGPAYREGLQTNDKIVIINGESAIGIKRDDVPKKLMGPGGSKVNIGVERDGWDEPHEFVLTRQRIIIDSIPYSLILENEVGYIRINRFTATTGTELKTSLDVLQRSGMKKLLIDLRDNSGGLMLAAIEVADIFIPGERLIVYKKGKSAASYSEYKSSGRALYPNLPLIILIDHASASASEIVAGAIQDWDRGLIVGEASFGKGLVQSQIRYSDNSALLITTAKYYTPVGRLIQREYKDKSKEQYYLEAYDDSSRQAISDTEDKPAFKTRLGRTVYGGGGITPDFHESADGAAISLELRKLLYAQKPFFATFADDFSRAHPEFQKEALQNKRSIEGFIENFQLTDEMYANFQRIVRELNYDFSPEQFERNREDIKFLLLREVVYKIWGDEGRLRANMKKDTQITRALSYFPQAEKLLLSSQSLDNGR